MKTSILDKDKIRKAFDGIDREALAEALYAEHITRSDKRSYVDVVASGSTIVSAPRAKEFERLTRGKVKAATLRPDIFDN